MNAEGYKLEARWGPRAETAEACAARLARMLTGLAAVHPIFAHWNKKAYTRAGANKPFCAMPPRVEELTRLFEKGKNYKDEPREPMLDLGYRVYAWNGLDDDRATSFTVKAGAYTTSTAFPNRVSLGMPSPQIGNEDLQSAALLKQVLLTVIAAWAPVWGGVQLWSCMKRWIDAAGQLQHPWAGWMTYLSAPLAPRVAPPPGAIHEPVPGGGLLVLATEESFAMDNPAHLAALDAIQAALKPIQI